MRQLTRIAQKSVQLADPHRCTDASDRLRIFNALFDALVQRDGEGQFVAALAASWEVQDDARCWTFLLRPDVVFHTGEILAAEDAAASIRRACAPEIGGEFGTEGVWDSYIGDADIQALDDQRLRIVTARPMADLLEVLVDIPIMPRHVSPSVADTYIGTGPYRWVETTTEHVRAVAFEHSKVRKPTAREITWQAIPDSQARIEALQSSQSDLITVATQSDADKAAAAGARVIPSVSNLCVAFLFNTYSPGGGSLALRQAVNHAVDVDRMIEVALGGAGSRLSGPLSPLHFGCDRNLPPYRYDRERARELIAESGAAPRLVIDVPMTLPDEAPTLADLLANDLDHVGLEVELRHFSDRAAYAEMVKAKQIDDLCCFDSSPLSTYRVLREKLSSDVAGPWWQGYHNSDVNALLEQASCTVDNAQRQSIYHQAYRLIHHDAPWLFLYHPNTFLAASKQLEDVALYGS